MAARGGGPGKPGRGSGKGGKGRGKVRPVRVFVARNVTEANLAVAFLEESGVPAKVEDALEEVVFDGMHILGKEGVGVVVASDREAAARAALTRFQARPGLPDDEDGHAYDPEED